MIRPAIAALLLGLLAAPLLAGPAHAQDAGEMLLRLNRLEGQVRQLSGQVEELQFENRQLKEQLQRFQEDVDFRFQDAAGGGGAARPARPPTPPASGQTPARRSDAFDPSAAPEAPGAPRPLGTTPPSRPQALPSAALAAPGSIADIIEDSPPPGAGAPLDLRTVNRGETGGAAAPRTGPSVAATGSADPRVDYDAAYAYLLQKQYERAEMGFRQFLQSHPRDRLVPDATFWLGETYLQRSRPREAAEQFLKVSTDHPRSPKAPDALLKLGIALSALGARDQACATFAELERKYPQASNSVRQGLEREQRRVRCTG